MKKFIITVAAVMFALGLLTAPAQGFTLRKSAVVPATTYDAYSMAFTKSAGQHWSGGQLGGQWSWSPQSATKSLIAWGDPSKGWPPSYNEDFEHVSDLSGDWLKLNGWYDNGTYYKVQTTSEWQAQDDCRTGRIFLPTGGPQHYVRWVIPPTGYCLYAEAVVTEQSTGKQVHYVHQQVWSPSAACPAPVAPIKDASGVVRTTQPTYCIQQWESYASDQGRASGDIALQVERSALLAQGLGMAYKITQTYPLVNGKPWVSNMLYAWYWG